MTEQPGRSRPAQSKPSSAIDTPRVASAGPYTRPSAAIRAAGQAFLARPAQEVVKTNTGSSTGARAAAAGARNLVRSATAPRPENGNQNDTILMRGRQPDLKQAKSPLAVTPNILPANSLSTVRPPVPVRSTSTIAAQLASVSPSPVRHRSQSPNRRASPNRRYNNKSPGRITAAGLRSPLADLPEYGKDNTNQFPVSAPRPTRPIPLTSNSRPKLDLDHAPVFTRNASSSSSQASPAKGSPNVLSQAAARSVTSVASPFELQERSSYLDRSPSINRTRSSSTVLESDLGSPLEPMETRSTISDGNHNQARSVGQSAAVGSTISKMAPIPSRNAGPRKAPPKPSLGSGQIKDYRTGMTDKKLTDAIVASSLSLQSSRASSPSKRDRPAPPRRSRSHSFLHRHHHDAIPEAGRNMIPMKPMKQTLRKQSKPDDDDEDIGIAKRGRRHFMRKHPNKHHEGDRKRWRDKVTERERKRYEGVWAANRGLYIFWNSAEPAFGQTIKPPTNDEMVVNVVVRDIWERSRLPKDVLEEIWDLVAQENAKALGRWEFVVGLWLIDQRLKGRKLPQCVSGSVWASVRNTIGLKVSSKPL